MYKFFLDNNEIRQPVGFDGFMLEKSRSELFGGFVYGAYGYVNAFTDLLFRDKVAVEIIKNYLATDGVGALVPFRVEFCSKVIFEGKVDIVTVSIGEDTDISCAITDTTIADLLTSKAEIEYEVMPTMQIMLHSKQLANVGTHTIKSELQFQKVSSVPISVEHYVPFSVEENSIDTLGSATFSGGWLLNSAKNQELIIGGVLKWEAVAIAGNLAYSLILKIVDSNNSVKYTKMIGSYVADAISKLEVAIIGASYNFKAGDKLYLLMQAGTTTTAKFVYKAESTLGVSSKEEVDNSKCAGSSVVDAIKSIVSRFGISDVICAIDELEFDLLTSGNNIRGLVKPINVSLRKIVENIRKRYNAEIKLGDGILYIYKADEEVDSVFLGNVLKYTKKIDVNRLYSGVKVGYSNWQAETKWKDDEFCSTRDYSTDFSGNSNVLDLMMDWICGGYLIEETRRLQFDAKKKAEEWKYDEALFLIRMDDSEQKAAANEGYTISNTVEAASVYNVAHSPARVLEEWFELLKFSGSLNYTAGTGNVAFVADGLVENVDILFGENSVPFLSVFKVRMTAEQFDGIGNYVEFEACGVTKIGKVKGVKWTTDRNGEGWAEFEVEE